jgi:hypothetical protein
MYIGIQLDRFHLHLITPTLYLYLIDFCLWRTWEYIRTGMRICVPHTQANRNILDRHDSDFRPVFCQVMEDKIW